MNNIKDLYYNIIDVSEDIAVNKTRVWKECDICPYWYFLDVGFKLQQHVCNVCHDILMMCMNLSDIAILHIHGADTINEISHKFTAKCRFYSKKVEQYKTQKFILTFKNGWRNYKFWGYWNWKT